MRIAILLALAGLTGAWLQAQVKLPNYTREILPNGITLDLLPRGELPLVEIQVLIKGGGESQPPDLAGIAEATVGLLRKGTPSRTSEQFSDQLDALGGTWRASSDAQAAKVTAEFLSKDFEAGFGLVSDAVLHPVFDEVEVKKLLTRSIDGSRASKDQPQQAIGRYAQAFFFGPKHPYGRVEDEISLSKLGREAILDYYKRAYTGANTIVIIAGKFDAGSAKKAVAASFGAVPPAAPYEWRSDSGLGQPGLTQPGSTQRENRLLLVDKPDATQTYFAISQPGISRANSDRYALLLVNTLFGGRFTSLLNDALRVNSGLTYGASSTYQQDRLRGAVRISSYTKTETTVAAIDMALDVLRKLNTSGVKKEQLDSARASVKGAFPTRHLETSGQLADELGEIELFGLNRGEVDDFFSSLDAVTPERANAAIHEYLKTDGLTFVLIGNASKIRDGVRKYAPHPIEVSVSKPGFGTGE